MSVILVFLLVIAGIAGWWLSQQRLMSKPWLEQGIDRRISRHRIRHRMPTAKIGLGVFLAVVGCLFALFTSAYFMRMELSDWQAAAGAAAAVVQHRRAGAEQRRAAMRAWSRRARARWTRCRLGLVTGGLTALGFPGRAADGLAGTGRRRLSPVAAIRPTASSI